MERLEQLMKALDITEEEARQVLKDDEAIDHGADLFPLNADQKKVEKKMRQADRKVTAYKFTKRERKANDSKRFLVEILQNAVTSHDGELLETVNPEREFLFTFEGVKYKVVLSAPRK